MIAHIRKSRHPVTEVSACSPDDRFTNTYSMVVICDLFILGDEAGSKDADMLPPLYCPVLCLAVWLTGVVDVPGFVAFHGCIDQGSTPAW